MAPAGDLKNLANANEEFSISWTRDGKLVTDKDYRLHAIDPNTGAQAAFGSDPGVPEFQQQACRDGSQVFVRYYPETKKLSVWTLDAFGQNPKRLSDGRLDQYPLCSSDLRWAYYVDLTTKLLMRVALEGGISQKVSDLQVEDVFSLSPDGSSALFATVSHAEGHKERFVEIAVDSRQVGREIVLQKPRRDRIHYSLDGKALEYVVRENGVDNIWRQPLDGSAGKWETQFKSEHISQFQWSPDRKWLALARGHTDSDVVLMREGSR
jgi:hypothetical protein